MKKKMYIAGCGGMLGDAFYSFYKNKYNLKCTDIDTNDNWLEYLDFNNFEHYKNDVEQFKPDILVHLGALTDLEYCELNPKHTYLTNYISVENATYIANQLDIPIVFISTAGIFDGKKDKYDDWDTPNPLCHYARSKYAAELFVAKYAKKSLVCRAGWMMGGGVKKDKKFVNKIIKQIIDNKKELYIVKDKLGTPTYTHDFVKNLDLLLINEFWGVYNLVCQDVTSRYDVALKIIELLNLQKKIKIYKVSSSYFKKDYFVKRPFSERLINSKLQLRNMDIMRDWKTCLEEYLNENFKKIL
ncbi:sugar nucleotide-binding protein [Pelagibacteraceae bacterium]|nr:sugar nucleotide-binding protein [Pelagibacteraceae bacterium]